MLEVLESQLEDAEAEHKKNQKAYHDALKEAAKANEGVRKTCEKASKSANGVAGLKIAIQRIRDAENPPKIVIVGEGEAKAGEATS